MNCTNYAAYVLGSRGVARPAGFANDASRWDTDAAADGIPVDHNPQVGAVAQWDGGNHVAIVEAYDSVANTITISESNYVIGGQRNWVDWRSISASNPDHYIHFGGTVGTSHPLEQVWAGAGWQHGYTGIDIAGSTDVSAVYMGGTWPMVMANINGYLWQITGTSGGWTAANTGVPLGAGASISAVNMGGYQPQVMATDGGYVWQIYASSNGWVKANTGLQATGQISSVYEPGYGWPMSMIEAYGQLYQAWGDSSGWHIMGTGVAVNGRISSVYMGGAAPTVVSLEGGTIYQTAATSSGWVKTSTGVGATGNVSAVKISGSQLQVFSSSGGQLYQAYQGASGWVNGALGVATSDVFSAVDVGGATAQIMNLG
jgi:hypothetical protein